MKRYQKNTVLVALCMAVIGLVIPAVASAASLQRENGTLVPLGTAYEAKSSNFALFNGFAGWITCESLELNQEVVENDGEAIETVGTPGSQAKDCSIEGVESASITNIQSSASFVGAEPGTMRLTLAVALPGGAVCKYVPWPLAVNYESGFSTISIDGEVKSSNCGSGWVEATFDLSDWSEEPLFVF